MINKLKINPPVISKPGPKCQTQIAAGRRSDGGRGNYKQKTKVLVGLSGGVDSSVAAPQNSLLSNRLRRIMTVRHKRGKLRRVLCGLSGGVDSSVAALLLKLQGYDVIGVFLKFTQMDTNRCTNKHESENKCCNYESLVAARSVADQLKIPFYVMDVSKEFKKDVVDYFIKEYDSGRTPNPCVVCNKKIKFGWMLEQAKKLNCQFIATGHYARIKRSFVQSQKDVHSFRGAQASGKRLQPTFCDCTYSLYKARDKKKDQSYFLWQLDQEQLAHILFPIGDYTKEEVREMAKKWKLPTASKQESQDLCFIGADQADFLADYAEKLNKPGEIVDLKGSVLGEHKGLCYYTVGQRQGLGVQIQNVECRMQNVRNAECRIQNVEWSDKIQHLPAGRQGSSFNIHHSGFIPAYVVRLDTDKNQLVVGSKEDLDSRELIAEKVDWINLPIANRQSLITNCQAKIRYGVKLSHCHIVHPESQRGRRVTLSRDKIKVTFDEPQRAVTPGQSIVFYSGEEVVGGGIIQ